jgi:uncharacterized paraquat-inducible protein A
MDTPERLTASVFCPNCHIPIGTVEIVGVVALFDKPSYVCPKCGCKIKAQENAPVRRENKD